MNKLEFLREKGYGEDLLTLLQEKKDRKSLFTWDIDEAYFLENLRGKAVKYMGKVFHITDILIISSRAMLVFNKGTFSVNKSSIKELKVV